jgi:PPOX class probable FMN-dependent enzyme
MDLRSRFVEVVTTEEQLRAVMGEPARFVLAKELSVLDSHARAFIGKSPFLIIGSCGSDGRLSLSPKGDPPGFVQVIDDTTLAIPERLGNRRADTFRNLLANDRIGLIFLIPGKSETLRVGGRAVIVRDTALRERMAVNGTLPDFAVVVEVDRMFFHCAKCVIRSGVWKHEQWPDLAGLPSLAETMVSAGKLRRTVSEMQAIVDTDAQTRLY